MDDLLEKYSCEQLELSENIVDGIDVIYESMPINTSIIVFDEDYLADVKACIFDILRTRSYPCLLWSHWTNANINRNEKHNDNDTATELCMFPNKTILCTPENYTSLQLQNSLRETDVDCVIFIGYGTFNSCVSSQVRIGKQRQQFIFTI